MKRIFSAKPIVASAIALGAVVAASAAHARSDVVFSVGINAPVGYVAPAPVYVQPRPVYVQPQPVYVQPQGVYVEPQGVYVQQGYAQQGVYAQPQPFYVQARPYVGHHYYAQRRGPHGDWDHDGVPNRFDRAPQNPYRY